MRADGKGLTTDEGVDEGSKESATESSHDDAASDVLGMRAVGTPENGEQQAAPELILTGQDEPSGPGQRQQVGEG